MIIHTFSNTTDNVADTFQFIHKTLHFIFTASSFFANCLSDCRNDFNQKNSCPKDRASFLSILTVWWYNSMISLGYRKTLSESDMWNLSDKLTTESAYAKFFKQYSKDFEKFKIAKAKRKLEENFFANSLNKEISKKKREKAIEIDIIRPFLRAFKSELTYSILFKLFSILSGFAQPILLNKILTYVRSENPIIWKGYVYVICMFVFSALDSILNNQYEITIAETSMKLKAALTVMVYKKTLVLSSSARKDFTTGEIVNFMSIDISRITEYLTLVNLIWASGLQILISTILIWGHLGFATIAGIGTMVIFMIPNSFITNRLKIEQIKQMVNKDNRTKILSEALSGIKVLKVYSWVEAFVEKIISFRNKEIKSLRTIMMCFALLAFGFNFAPFLVSATSFFSYVFIYTDFKDRLDANKIFVSMSLFNIIRVPLGLIPILISNAVMCRVSIKRLNKYLSGDELEENNIEITDLNHPIEMENCFFTWEETENRNDCTLKNISLKVKKNDLVAIVGSVGSGKSSLLFSLLKEMKKLSGKLAISDTVAYIPQQAWIQNASVKDNIIFGEKFDEKKYEDIIDRTQLREDLKILSAGDDTEIGEKGINLSGGQKQRINIARAVYSDKSIYLFDDPLSALDSNVGKEVFDKIISNDGILKNKTRLLVTHRISLLKNVDHIIVMKDGQISENGSYNELMNKKGVFADLVVQFLSEAYQKIDDKDKLLEEFEGQISKEIRESTLSLNKLASNGSPTHKKILNEDPKKSPTRSSSILSKSSINLEIDKKIEREQEQESLKTKKSKAKLIETERLEIGSVKIKVYWKYIKSLGVSWYLISLISYVISHVFNIFSQLWLSEWSNDSLNPNTFDDKSLRNKRLLGYAGFGASEMVFVLISTIVLSLSCLDASRKIHNQMLYAVFKAPMYFFDTTPLGRILNRLSKDVDTADFNLYLAVRGVIVYLFRASVSFILIILETPLFLVALVPIIALYTVIQNFYISTSRQLKRLESIARSPIYSHFQETVSGAPSIRAYKIQDKFIQECCNRFDANQRISYANLYSIRWLTLRLEFLGYLIVFLAVLSAILFRDNLTPGLVGVSITSALTITMTLNQLIKSYSDLETQIVSVERCLEYTALESERLEEIPENKPKDNWPSKGCIKFENYSTKYRPGLDLVLKSVNFNIKEGEKVGIVGRTGAGKSTITLALFRIIESVTGRILIDDVDIGQIGLKNLRSKLTIIPQDPILFTGTIRFNLDPFKSYKDDEIWKSLKQAHLDKFVQSLEFGLDSSVAESGENLSVGQRQLLCLARALLRKSKILVLDEATAAVDIETDELIQTTIRREFGNCTICTIAHRLNTVIDYDKILVLDQGSVAEYDSPNNLLNDKSTIFYSMAVQSGLV